MASVNFVKEKSASVKNKRIDMATHKTQLHDGPLKETRFGKYLRRTVHLSGYLLALCLMAIFVIFAYIVTSGIVKENVPSVETTHKKIASRADQCTNVEDNRFDCFPEKFGSSEGLCVGRGCCWRATTKPDAAPLCFFPTNYDGYSASNLKYTPTGITATLQRSSSSSIYPRDVKTLQLVVEYQTSTRLRLRIFDPNNARFEVPLDTPSGSSDLHNPLYTVTIQQNPFNIIIKRNSTGATVFDTTDAAPLIFSDQFLQIATQLSTKYLYGFGEHRSTFQQDLSRWRRLAFWNRDDVPKVDNNGYGTHPFFLNLESGGPASNSYAHGVFLLNSNAGEVATQPVGSGDNGAVTYRMLGGIFDFYIFLGPSPLSVVQQYSEVIGRPYFPPFWSLGYHICKYGINTATDLQNMINRNRAAQIPYDIQWSDIDYMTSHRDWTYDKDRYANLPSIVKDLHDNNQRYIIMADPAISSEQPSGTYPPYDDGVKMDIFVKNDAGGILVGRVWPGNTAFPDFFHPKAVDYWYKQAKEFHDQIPFDGLWIDMNEPSNFVDGSISGCTSNELDNPPFTPATIDGGKLISKTICPSAKHVISTHYNLHNMYGWSQSNVSRRTLDLLYPNKRSPIITRSSFAGTGKLVGHWLGDNFSSFSEMYYSIPAILNFNLFGIPQIGADICGFNGATTPELCTRWHQLGAFYPFMRNHAEQSSPAQDPGFFQQPFRDYMKTAIELRYRLLAVLYTAFYQAHTQGLPIVRPLFFLYPGTEAIDKQFMWNDQLLVSPVLDQGASTVQAFIPDDVFYDFFTGSLVTQRGKTIQLNAPIDYINVHVRGGSILPLLPATQRTNLSRKEKFQLIVAVGTDGGANGELFWDDGESIGKRKEKFQLIVAVGTDGGANGELFWDDGESIDSISGNKYSNIRFSLANSNHLTSTVVKGGYNPPEGVKLGTVIFYGINRAPGSVSVNGKVATFNYNANLKVVNVNNLDVDLLTPLSLVLN